MASQAYEKTLKKLETPDEGYLADMIMRDINQLAEDAKAQGVTAYLRKPVHRKKPNERFLQGTIRSVAFANRKAEEDEMWAQRTKRPSGRDRMPQCSAGRSGGEGSSEGHSSEMDSRGSDSAESDSEAEPPGALSHSELAEMLSRHRPRGRGAVGSRADEPGPFLPQSALADVGPDDFTVRGPVGPERPAWLQRNENDVASPTGMRGGALEEGSASDLVKAGYKVKRASDSKPKTRKAKKKKKEERHKEKKRRKKEKG